MISALLAPLLKWIAGGLLFLCLILGMALHFERVHSRKLGSRVGELTELRKADRRNYEAAAKEADEKNKAHVAQIEKQQESINEKARSDYARDLDRLRSQSRTPQGSAGGAKAPGVPRTPGGAHADGLPPAPCDNLCASEIELRLMHLQNWIDEQLQIPR